MRHTSKVALLATITLCLALAACGDDTVYEEADNNATTNSATTNTGTTQTTDTNTTTSQCDPGVDTNCICTDNENGAVCDPNDDAEGTCTCVLVSNNNAFNPNNGGTSTAGWRFVLVEDQSDPVAGEFPGSDVDAIELTDSGGTSFFATTVEDFQLGGGSALDLAQVLGAPDSNCDPRSGAFVALGGRDAGGYVIVGFSTSGQDVTFGAGSTVTVHEIGQSMCGTFDDDLYSISVSVSTNRTSFTQIGTASGLVAVPITVNP